MDTPEKERKDPFFEIIDVFEKAQRVEAQIGEVKPYIYAGIGGMINEARHLYDEGKAVDAMDAAKQVLAMAVAERMRGRDLPAKRVFVFDPTPGGGIICEGEGAPVQPVLFSSWDGKAWNTLKDPP